jgi:hypothetical protein
MSKGEKEKGIKKIKRRPMTKNGTIPKKYREGK